MKIAATGKLTRILFTMLVLCLPAVARAEITFSSIVVFGTSLSDPGNAYALLTQPVSGLSLMCNVTENTPPYQAVLDENFVPCAPYATGGHHYTNGGTWIEQFAQGKGLSGDTGAAFQSNGGKARNYAVGGARATNYPGKVNLPQQVQTFLSQVGQAAPADALYVIEIGNNDVGDALRKFVAVYQQTGNLDQAIGAANIVLGEALNNIAANMQTLYVAGARKFLVTNAAKWDQLPAVMALGPAAQTIAANLANGFNLVLAQGVLSKTALGGLPGIQIAQLDLAGNMGAIIGNPGSFGLTNVTAPCVTPNVAPYTCQQPATFFFWDGIHPTAAVHGVIARLAAEALAQQ